MAVAAPVPTMRVPYACARARHRGMSGAGNALLRLLPLVGGMDTVVGRLARLRPAAWLRVGLELDHVTAAILTHRYHSDAQNPAPMAPPLRLTMPATRMPTAL